MGLLERLERLVRPPLGSRLVPGLGTGRRWARWSQFEPLQNPHAAPEPFSLSLRSHRLPRGPRAAR
eukprot:scaffold31395_cov48-Phaeocystis_antarctica.AAC.1